MPPELLTKGILSKAADAYAWGVILWELFSGQRPWADMISMQVRPECAYSSVVVQFCLIQLRLKIALLVGWCTILCEGPVLMCWPPIILRHSISDKILWRLHAWTPPSMAQSSFDRPNIPPVNVSVASLSIKNRQVPQVLNVIQYSLQILCHPAPLKVRSTKQVLWIAQVIYQTTILGKTLDFPESTPQGYRKLGEDCLHQDPNQRPTFKEILERLRTLWHSILAFRNGGYRA